MCVLGGGGKEAGAVATFLGSIGHLHITKTCLYNFDPLKPHFLCSKTGVYRVMLTHNLCFEQKYEKYSSFYLKIFIFFFVVKFSVYLNRLVFVMKYFFGVPFKTDYFDFFFCGVGGVGAGRLSIFSVFCRYCENRG